MKDASREVKNNSEVPVHMRKAAIIVIYMTTIP